MLDAETKRRHQSQKIRKKDSEPVIFITSNSQGYAIPSQLSAPREGRGRRKGGSGREDTLPGRRGGDSAHAKQSNREDIFLDGFDRIVKQGSDRQDTVAEPGRGGRESNPEMDSAQGRRDDFSEESTANSADKSDADWEDEENPTLSVLTEAKFDFAEAQRCRPGKERSDYLERTGVSYGAYRIVRDLTEQLQQREPSSSSSNQVVVMETPKLLDQPVTYKTIKNFEDYITRHRQQDQIGVRNAGITSQARLLIGPRINGWAQNHPNSSEKAELEQNHIMAWLGWKHDKFFAILTEVFANLPGRAQAGGSLLQALTEVKFEASGSDFGLSAYQMDLLRVTTTFAAEEVQALTAKEIHMYLIKPLTDRHKDDVFYSTLYNEVRGDGNCSSVEDFLTRLSAALMRRLELARLARQQGMKLLVASNDRKRRHDHERGSAGGEDEESTARRKRPRNKKSKEETRTSQDRKRDQPRPEQKELCQGCGRTGHTRDKCMLPTHPRFQQEWEVG